jgi:valyl-tRNA synthetase
MPAVDLDPDEVQALYAQAEQIKLDGNTLFGQGDYDQAIDCYQRALTICPPSKTESTVYWANMAAAQLKLEKYEDAVRSCTKALEVDPKNHKARIRRAQANEKIGKWSALTSALKDYDIVMEFTKDYRSTCEAGQERLPGRIELAQKEETGEMMGKLKDLGNMFLGKFGLSTDNFQTQPGEGGGYSVNFVNKQ